MPNYRFRLGIFINISNDITMSMYNVYISNRGLIAYEEYL